MKLMPKICFVTGLASTVLAAGVAGAAPALTSVYDYGSSNGLHYFWLYGSGFSDPHITVTCNGAWMGYVRDSWSSTAIHVYIGERPSSSECSFIVTNNTDGSQSGELLPSATYISAPPWEITGVNDRGITSGWHYFELYGRAPSSPKVAVNCNNTAYTAYVTYASSGQVNIAFSDAATPTKGCEFVLTDSTGTQRSNAFFLRVDGLEPAYPSKLAAYFWGGHQPETAVRNNALQHGIATLRDAGFTTTVRLAAEPRMLRQTAVRNEVTVDSVYEDRYNFINNLRTDCPPGTPFLPCAIQTSYYQSAFAQLSEPSTFIITTTDSATFGPTGDTPSAGWMDPNFWTPEQTSIVSSEYHDLAYALFATQDGHLRHFIISNWEGDNLLYCGNAFGYSEAGLSAISSCGYYTDPSCNLNWNPSCIPRSTTSADLANRFSGLTSWFIARRSGIAQAQAEAAQNVANGTWLGGPVVDDAIEFNAYLMIKNPAIPLTFQYDVLHDVIPAVEIEAGSPPGYASYSAWESVYMGRLDQDLSEIGGLLPYGTSLMVGEAGYAHSNIDWTGDPTGGPGAELQWRFGEIAKAGLRSSAAPITLWEAFNTVELYDGLLWTAEGRESPTAFQLRTAINNTAPLGRYSGYLKPRATVDRGITSGYHYMEVYGDFYPNYLGGSLVPSLRCDNYNAVSGVSIQAGSIVTDPNDSNHVIQFNIQFPDAYDSYHDYYFVSNGVTLRKSRFCTLKVSDNGTASDDFGPTRFCAVGPCCRKNNDPSTDHNRCSAPTTY